MPPLIAQLLTVSIPPREKRLAKHHAKAIKLGLPPCRKLHRHPRFYSDFPQFFPKTICAGFRSRDPGAYPCRAAALVSAQPPEFFLSFSYQYWISTSIHAGLLFPHIPSIVTLLWPDFFIVQCTFFPSTSLSSFTCR
jgi:hypothetical protein